MYEDEMSCSSSAFKQSMPNTAINRVVVQGSTCEIIEVEIVFHACDMQAQLPLQCSPWSCQGRILLVMPGENTTYRHSL